MSTVKEPLVRTSLATLVYDRLLESILSGQLGSGAEINVSDVAKEYGVSPIPVREALVRLSTEGLVETSANRRARVVHFSRDEMVATFQVRAILEAGAAALAAPRITKSQLAELRQLNEQRTQAHLRNAEVPDFLDKDSQFHLRIAEIAGNELLRSEIARFGHLVRVIQRLQMAAPAMDANLTNQEHERILDGLKSGRPALAEEAMRAHLDSALARLLREYDERSEGEPTH